MRRMFLDMVGYGIVKGLVVIASGGMYGIAVILSDVVLFCETAGARLFGAGIYARPHIRNRPVGMTSFAELHPAIEVCQPTTLRPCSRRNCVIRHVTFRRMLSTFPGEK